MADYYAILKRAISGLAEPTGESRRSVYEKARTALVAQLKSFDPPLSASEITQQRLQLEDAIRKVESESAKGLLSQALSRASLPERPVPATPAALSTTRTPTPTPVSTPAPPEPLTQNRLPRPTPPTGQPAAIDAGPAARPPLNPPAGDVDARTPTGPTRPPLHRPQLTPATPTGASATMRMTRPQFEPAARASEPERPTGQPAYSPTPATPTRPVDMSSATGRDRIPSGNTQRLSEAETLAANYEQQDVTQPVANRVLKKAVNDIDRLGSATQETARRARDALAVTETPLDEELSTGSSATRKPARRPLTNRNRPASQMSERGLNPATGAPARRASRWPMIIGLVVALAVVALGATALYMKRDVIASYLGAQKPLLEMVQHASSEKPVVKSMDRLPQEDPSPKSGQTSNVKVVTTQPISPSGDPAAPGGHTDVTPASPSGTASASNAAPVPLPAGEVPPIAQKATLLEEASDGTSPPVQSTGKVIWQLVKVPSTQAGQPDNIHLVGNVEIPGRGIGLTITVEQNTDPHLQASHLIKLEFKLPPDFDYKSIDRVMGFILKSNVNERGDPLSGATAKITNNNFWFALYSSDPDKAKNIQLLKDRTLLDIAFIYENKRHALLTIEKDAAGERAFDDALAAWGN